MKQYAVEFIGTFFLTLVVALTGNPLAIGAVLVAMVYMGGAVSGAHYNPAVTLALYLRGAVKYKQAIRYIGVQLAASFVAAAVYYLLKGVTFNVSPAEGVSFSQALLVELLFTFALASTVLYTAASKATKGNQFYGLAIGLVVAAGAFAAGPISGGALNPAVGVGPLLFDMATLQSHGSWVLLYLIGPISGGALAAMLYREVVLES
jgi:aquaporin Z